MCLMCQEEDLYFLYLEQRERAQKLARGETSPPDPGWLWPAFVTAHPPQAAQPPQAVPAPSRPAEHSEPAAPPASSAFVCDAPE